MVLLVMSTVGEVLTAYFRLEVILMLSEGDKAALSCLGTVAAAVNECILTEGVHVSGHHGSWGG